MAPKGLLKETLLSDLFLKGEAGGEKIKFPIQINLGPIGACSTFGLIEKTEILKDVVPA